MKLTSIIFRAKLKPKLEDLRILFGFYGSQLVTLERLVELSKKNPKERGDLLLDIARELKKPEAKLAYLQVIHLYLTHNDWAKIAALKQQLPPKLHDAIARYPIPDFAGVNVAADLIPSLGYAVAFSLVAEDKAEQFNKLMKKYLIETAEKTKKWSALEVTKAFFLDCVWEGRHKVMLQLYQETDYKDVIQLFLNPKYVSYLKKTEVKDVYNELPKSGCIKIHTQYLHINRLVVKVLTTYPVWTPEQLKKFGEAFKEALPNPENGGVFVPPRWLINDLGIVNIAGTAVKESRSLFNVPEGMESLSPVAELVQRQGGIRASERLGRLMLENPQSILKELDENFTTEMMIFALIEYIYQLSHHRNT